MVVTIVVNGKSITITSIAELNELLQRIHISTAGNLITEE
jgi:sulfur carrier protein ThiS